MKPLSILIGLCLAGATSAQTPYINKVYDFCPAPGQFTHDIPEFETGDSRSDMIRKANESISGDQKVMISLGGYGGYVLFGFDHLIENKPGKYDFKIWGNAFYSEANPNPDGSTEGGSCEPGIVMVSHDDNNNGLPDDAWYELAGSEYFKQNTIHDYRITYHRPDPNKTPTPNEEYPFLTDTTYIRWDDNQNRSGHIAKNSFHTQPYYPQWITDNQLSFEGTKLADNYIDESGEGAYYVLYAYRWGYADNHPNNDNRSAFDISWAVDNEGNQVQLPGIHFVKVYTAVNQSCGWLGETSTEILGAEDLHIQGYDITVPAYTEGIQIDQKEIQIAKGESKKLTAKVFSSNPLLEKTIWASTNEQVATIETDGTINALTLGTTQITATTQNGRYTDQIKVEITSKNSDIDSQKENIQRAIYSNGQLSLLHFDNYQGTIISSNGETKTKFNILTDNQVINLDLPSGLYILKAQKRGNTQITKFIVK